MIDVENISLSVVESAETKTVWHFDSEFKCGGMLRLMATIMPSMFKKQSEKDMQNFKKFCEAD